MFYLRGEGVHFDSEQGSRILFAVGLFVRQVETHTRGVSLYTRGNNATEKWAFLIINKPDQIR